MDFAEFDICFLEKLIRRDKISREQKQEVSELSRDG